MNKKEKDIFTKDDLIKLLYDSLYVVNETKTNLNIIMRASAEFLDKKSFIENVEKNNYCIQSSYPLFIDIKNKRSGGVYIDYNPYTDEMSATSLVHSFENHKIFSKLPASYERTIFLNNNNIKENWNIVIKINEKRKRIISLVIIDNIVKNAISTVIEFNENGLANHTLLTKDQTFIFNSLEDKNLLINKLKLTYYREIMPTNFDEVTQNRPLKKIFTDTNDVIERYVSTLEMLNI